MTVRPSLLVIHCAATPNGRRVTAEDIQHWHTDPPPTGNGWERAGYHYVVEVSGRVETLVPLDSDEFLEPWEIANGARGYNGRSVHVCLIGTDRFTAMQWLSLTALVADIEKQFRGIRLVGHRDLNPGKSCPGFNVHAWNQQGRRILAGHDFAAAA